MNAKGLIRTCLYVCCGCEQVRIKGVEKEIRDFLERESLIPKACENIIKILEKLHPYESYCQIKSLKGIKSPFNPNVVKDYWLGDSKLETYYLCHNFTTLARFREINSDEHLPDWIANEMLDCAISFGEILEIGSKKLKVLNHRLLYEKGRVFWRKEIRDIDKGFVDNIQKGDLVSIHWAVAREKISQKQAQTLRDITIKAIKTLQIA